MKKCLYPLCVLAFMMCSIAAFASAGTGYQFIAPVISGNTYTGPVGIELTPGILAKTSRNLADLRIFDDLGNETPYVIYQLSRPAPVKFTWKVIDYQEKDRIQTIVLESTGKNGWFKDLVIHTTARDFNKEIEVYASPDTVNWGRIAFGTIYDFSSHIDLTKTDIEFPQTTLNYLKVILRDQSVIKDAEPSIELRYKDLEFIAEKRDTDKMIRIGGVTSSFFSRDYGKNTLTEITIRNPAAQLDKEGNTIFDLGNINLPIEEISLRIENRFYYREVELSVSASDDEKAYHTVGRKSVFRIPGVLEKKNTVSFKQAQHAYARLRIVNNDNPQLVVEEIKISWKPKHLYFIPEKGRTYTLYFGNSDSPHPRYELPRLVAGDFDRLTQYEKWDAGVVQINKDYSPAMDTGLKKLTEKYIFNGLIVLLAVLMGIWIFHLMKKIHLSGIPHE